MADGKLPTIKRPTAAPAKVAPAPEVVPLYDPKKCSELRGGVGLVQEDNVFNPSGGHGFVRKIPKEQGYYLTPEQQTNYVRQLAKQKQALNPLTHRAPPEAMPDKLVQAHRENAQALAAELHAE